MTLTNDQFGEIVQQFVEIQVENMDIHTMEEWITDELIYQYGKLTPEELEERINSHGELVDYDGLYEELVDNVCSDDRLTNVQP